MRDCYAQQPGLTGLNCLSQLLGLSPERQSNCSGINHSQPGEARILQANEKISDVILRFRGNIHRNVIKPESCEVAFYSRFLSSPFVPSFGCSPRCVGTHQNSFSWLAKQVDYRDVVHSLVPDKVAAAILSWTSVVRLEPNPQKVDLHAANGHRSHIIKGPVFQCSFD